LFDLWYFPSFSFSSFLSDKQLVTMSSVTPSESASSAGKRKNRPGKNARQAARASAPPGATSQTGSSSVSKASFFASQLPSDPVPQPGRFPVVFQTGVGEPTKDVNFCFSPEVINGTTSALSQRYIFNPRYAEFSSDSDYTDDLFERDLVRAFLLGVAQQTVHTHVNMGLPLGDFSSISSTDVFLPTSLRSVVSQFGEFSLPALGTRFLLRNYVTTVSSLVFAASKVVETKVTDPVHELWLPMSTTDTRTRFIVANALSQFIYTGLNITLDVEELSNHIFTDTWSVFDALKTELGDDDVARDRFDFLFSGYTDEAQFVTKFLGAPRQAVLHQLNLRWDDPVRGDLNFSFVPKVMFPELVDKWARKRSAIAKFVSVSSGLTNRAEAVGSAAQISSVKNTEGVTLVKTHVALPAPELSLLACFPSTAFFGSVGPLNVVMTTSIPTAVRATEFLQMDWLG
jgi:hypothetical protein